MCCCDAKKHSFQSKAQKNKVNFHVIGNRTLKRQTKEVFNDYPGDRLRLVLIQEFRLTKLVLFPFPCCLLLPCLRVGLDFEAWMLFLFGVEWAAEAQSTSSRSTSSLCGGKGQRCKSERTERDQQTMKGQKIVIISFGAGLYDLNPFTCRTPRPH